MFRSNVLKLLIFFSYAGLAQAYEISEVILKSKDIRKFEVLQNQASLWEDGCSVGAESKPVLISIQTQLLYEKPEMYEQIMGKVEKAHVTIRCKSGSGSIIYLKFTNSIAADQSFGFLRGLIWGEGGRSKRHPERLQKYSNIIAIFSSQTPGMIDYLQLGKIIYSNIPTEVLQRIRDTNNCSNAEAADFCEALVKIQTYKPSPLPAGFSKGSFAAIWHLRPGKNAEKSYAYGKLQNGKIGLRDVSPDNEKESKEMTEMMKGTMAPTKEILQFVATLELEFKILENHEGSYRMNLGGNVYALYPIGNKVYFIVTADHFLDEQGTTITGYFLIP